MSIYLSKYYCGNLENKCNYQEPLDYTKITNRQFVDLFSEKTEACDKMKGKKGLCCVKNKNTDKEMNKEYMNRINKESNMEIFKENEEVPLVKINNKDGKIDSIDLCNCGGSENYKECIEENCKDFKKPTIYEYCKLGNYNNHECLIDENEVLAPGVSYDNKTERCKLKTLREERVNINIDKLTMDCYNKLCENRNLNSLKNRYTTDDKYFKIGDNPKAFGMTITNNKNEGKSLREYLKRQ